MRIQVASDLHLEFLEGRFPGYRCVEPVEADLLVLAGDIHAADRALASFADWPVPVICLPGNHEYYRGDIGRLEPLFASGPVLGSARMAERQVLEFAGVRMLCATLWTDYELYGDAPAAMEHAAGILLDHKAIGMGAGSFTPSHARTLHKAASAWLAEHLAEPFSGSTVVCTHHAPHPNSIHAMYEDNAANPAFISDLSRLLPAVDLWIHGHVHNSFDYRVGRCRVVANPRGYALNRRQAERVTDLQWENAAFDPRLVIEV